MDDLRQLLREAADPPTRRFDLDAAYRKGRRRRRMVIGGRVIAAAVLVLGLLGGLSLLRDGPGEQVATEEGETAEVAVPDWYAFADDELGYSADVPAGWFSSVDGFTDEDHWNWGGDSQDLLVVSNDSLDQPDDLCASVSRLSESGVLIWLNERFAPDLGYVYVDLDTVADLPPTEVFSGEDPLAEGCMTPPKGVRLWVFAFRSGGRFVNGRVFAGSSASDSELALAWETVSGFEATPGHQNLGEEHLINPAEVDFVAGDDPLWSEIGDVVRKVFGPATSAGERAQLMQDPLLQEAEGVIADWLGPYEGLLVNPDAIALSSADAGLVEFSLYVMWSESGYSTIVGPFLAEVVRGEDGQWKVTNASFCAIVEPVTSCE